MPHAFQRPDRAVIAEAANVARTVVLSSRLLPESVGTLGLHAIVLQAVGFCESERCEGHLKTFFDQVIN